jgi:hypothetical protein
VIDRALALGAAFAAAAYGAALVEAIKFQRRVRVGLSPVDAASIAAAVAAVGALAALSPWAGAAAASLGALFFAGLWLDAVLFRVYTIEMGVAGARSIVVPVLYRELSEVSFARGFLREHAPFLAAPPLVAVALAVPSPLPRRVRRAVVRRGDGAGMLGLARRPRAARSPPGPLAAALAGGAQGGRSGAVRRGGVAWPRAGAEPAPGRPQRLPPALVGAPPPGGPRLHPRPEHAAQPSSPPGHPGPARRAARRRAATSFAHHRVARARSRVAARRRPDAVPEAVAKDGGACGTTSPCPMTNEAHRSPRRRVRPLRSLPCRCCAGPGTPVYLTPYRTAHYGLDELLAKAGFDAVLTGRRWGAGATGR